MAKTISLGPLVTAEEVTAALTREQAPDLRKRLDALRLILTQRYTAHEVGAIVGIKRAQLFNWIKICRAKGLAGLLAPKRQGGGRRPSISNKLQEEMNKGILQKRWCNDQELLTWLKQQKVTITISGVRYWRRQLGFAGKRGRPRKLTKHSAARRPDALKLHLDEPNLAQIEKILSRSVFESRSRVLQALLLLAARSLHPYANSNQAVYHRILQLAVHARSKREPVSLPVILTKYEQTDWSLASITKEVQCSRSSCYRWVTRLKQKGIAQLFKRR